MKAPLLLILTIAFTTSAAFANTTESCDARAALSETMLEARMTAGEREISQPLFMPPAPNKVAQPVVIQLSESEVEVDEEDFVLDEE